MSARDILLIMTVHAGTLCAQSPGSAPSENFKLERDIPYAQPANPRQMLDVYAPADASNLPVVIWIHGGGWQAGDKTGVGVKPAAFTRRGLIFVSVSYRFVPHVAMEAIIRDIAASVRWVHDNIRSRGGDPERLFLMGHSAGAQLAALVSIDETYLKSEGLTLKILKGCVPVDGDTYDIPLQVATAAARRKSLGQPDPKFGHPEKFGPPDLQRRFSAVRHIAAGKDIPPFLILHVAEHTDTTAQAHRLWSELQESGVPAKMFAPAGSDHIRLDRDLGTPDDASTAEIFAFVEAALKR